MIRVLFVVITHPERRRTIMKLITRSLILLIVLLSVSIPVQAQNPAVHMTPGPAKEGVKVTLHNLSAAVIGIGFVELQIFDQKTCKRFCARRFPINKKIASCQTLDFEIRCSQQIPNIAGYIYFLRVRDGSGVVLTQDWLFNP
jgi:hypothetical protein